MWRKCFYKVLLIFYSIFIGNKLIIKDHDNDKMREYGGDDNNSNIGYSKANTMHWKLFNKLKHNIFTFGHFAIH